MRNGIKKKKKKDTTEKAQCGPSRIHVLQDVIKKKNK